MKKLITIAIMLFSITGCVDNVVGPTVYYYDSDGDGYGDSSITSNVRDTNYISLSGDCDDNNPSINPRELEEINGIDDNCDGNVDEKDFKYMFITSSTHTGNMGGLSGAHAICQSLADSSGLPSGTYKAWVSAPAWSAGSAVPLDDRQWAYKNVNGDVLGMNFRDLVNDINNLITYDQNGNYTTGRTWTSTYDQGSIILDQQTCSGWTSTSGDGGYGISTNYEGWSDSGLASCGNAYRLYCIEI